jgi:hypothetical protein
VTTYSSLNSISFFIEVIVIVAPPLSVAYPFILDVASYPAQIINLFVILVRAFPLLSSSPQYLLIVFEQGLFYLRWKKSHLSRPFKGTPIQLHPDVASLLISDNVVWLPLAIFFLLAEAFCTLSHALFECHKEKLTCLSPSDNLPVSAPNQWGRRHTPTSLLPILSCRNCCLDAWGTLLGHLEARASIHIQIPLGT